MAFDSEEIRKRQQRRRQEAQRRKEQQKLLRKRIIIGLIAAAVVLALCGLVILLLQHTAQPEPSDPSGSETTLPAQTQPTQPETVIDLAFGGDLNVTDKVVASGTAGDGYDYTDVFMDIVPLFAGADAAAVNFEGNLCGAPYGTENTRAPQALMEALSAAGVDMIQMANSCTVNNGLLGLSSTLDGIRAAGMEPLGAYATPEEFERSGGFTLRSIHGVKVAFVAFTKGVSSMGLPAGSEDCVNLLYKDYTSTYQEVDTEGITQVLEAVALEQPDVTIAMLHWGSEYNSQISDTQEQIVKLMQKNGVDAIIGTHSHYVQAVEYEKSAGTLVAYSLGDLYGDADRSGTNYSIVLNLQITKNNQTGEAKITGYDCTPIYTVTQQNDGVATTRILRIRDAIASFEANSIDKVSEETYNAMKSALSKIQSRTEPKK